MTYIAITTKINRNENTIKWKVLFKCFSFIGLVNGMQTPVFPDKFFPGMPIGGYVLFSTHSYLRWCI